MPVSYTHLDVYKRQCLIHSYADRFTPATLTIWRGGKTRDIAVTPVSYTHLDVYKRQALY